MKLYQIHSQNPQPRLITKAVEVLRSGGVIIYPTDTVYAMGCDIYQSKAIDKLCKIKGVKPTKVNLSIICNDLSHLSEFAKQVDNSVFKLMKKLLPGPYTFILKASSLVPKILHHAKKTIGIRVPDGEIVQMIVKELGNPIITSSLKSDDVIIEYPTDPVDIVSQFGHLVDMIIDGGYGKAEASTVLDATTNEVVVVREGLGETSFFY
jgi:tRNA threonylcarbamoyl adenosine modification protein (Sua5/YciO/YrdC/YwlC family)